MCNFAAHFAMANKSFKEIKGKTLLLLYVGTRLSMGSQINSVKKNVKEGGEDQLYSF